jgi:hypothetical protein
VITRAHWDAHVCCTSRWMMRLFDFRLCDSCLIFLGCARNLPTTFTCPVRPTFLGFPLVSMRSRTRPTPLPSSTPRFHFAGPRPIRLLRRLNPPHQPESLLVRHRLERVRGFAVGPTGSQGAWLVGTGKEGL